jgi:uncharacterized membrane protein
MSLTNIFTKLFAALFLIVTLSLTAISVPTYSQAIPTTDTLCKGGACPVIANPTVANADQNTLAGYIIGVARFLTFIIGALAVLFLVYGGFLYVTDPGTGDGATKGKTIIINAVIGLIIAIVAYTIVGLVGSLLQGNIAGQIIQ